LPAEIGGIDVQAVALAVTGVGGVVGAMWAGIRAGVKKVQANEADAGARFAGGVLMDNTSMLLLTEALRDTSHAVGALGDDVRECRHQIERLRDKL